MRKFTVAFILAMSALSGNANADALGLYIGGGSWDHDPSGSFGTVDEDVIDMEADLKYSGEKDSYVYAAFEHFVPLVPNVRIERATMGHTGIATTPFDFNGVPVSGASSINIDNTDAILYWRLLDNWVNFDLGFTARKLDADFTVGGETVAVSETIPMLYLAAQFDLPLTGLSVGGDINVVSYDDNTYQDIRIRALYEMGVIGFEVGLKTTSIELKDVDNINADLEFKGMMVGAFLHF
ncbi:MAG: TIGR04219 family outer membrane beta-barrel protein [Gammaproteobacteria bacterium]|nr:TIGR04219 family outer membrane beta-barrel protein [Gammaproteobacteria bacterium]